MAPELLSQLSAGFQSGACQFWLAAEQLDQKNQPFLIQQGRVAVQLVAGIPVAGLANVVIQCR